MVIEPTGVITALALTLIGVGVVVRMMPVGTCPECSHCRQARLEQQLELEERSAKFYGIPQCGACGRYHDPAEDHPA
jgi:hypothetical protein